VGDPFKDTSSVAMNPVIKFTTLFGLLAVEMAIELSRGVSMALAAIFFVLTLVFVYRSFYSMRIEEGENDRPASDEEDEEEDEDEAQRAQEA
jgi:K(+)-stimulated pyrophosphate-energized sodium pump